MEWIHSIIHKRLDMSNFDSIHEVVKQQTASARVAYLDLARLSAGRVYDNFPNQIDDAKSKISSLFFTAITNFVSKR